MEHSLPDANWIVPCGTGLGAGASGASAGLLHPYTPRGKLLWRGEECMEAALDLVAVAMAAARPHAAMQQGDSRAGAGGGPALDPFVWRQPILRPAVTAKQVRVIMQCQADCAPHPVQQWSAQSGGRFC